MFLINGLSNGIMGLVGCLIVCFLLLGAFLLFGVIAFVLIQRSKRAKTIAENTATIISQVDFTDGLDEKELAIIQKLFANKKKEELEASVKEKLVKVAGYETE